MLDFEKINKRLEEENARLKALIALMDEAIEENEKFLEKERKNSEKS